MFRTCSLMASQTLNHPRRITHEMNINPLQVSICSRAAPSSVAASLRQLIENIACCVWKRVHLFVVCIVPFYIFWYYSHMPARSAHKIGGATTPKVARSSEVQPTTPGTPLQHQTARKLAAPSSSRRKSTTPKKKGTTGPAPGNADSLLVIDPFLVHLRSFAPPRCLVLCCLLLHVHLRCSSVACGCNVLPSRFVASTSHSSRLCGLLDLLS